MNALVLHIDVDAFFASVEQLLIPSLRERPVIVGSGCIASCSYEARAFGLRAGMGLAEAAKLCPKAVVLEGEQNIYRCFAEHIWRIARRYTTFLETFLDEAYGDATGLEHVHGPPLVLGRKLQQHVRDEVGLPVSVGLAANRMMAGIASHFAKPYGVAWIEPGREEQYLQDLPVQELPGVGHRTREVLADMSIRTIGDLRTLPRQTLAAMFGLRGAALYERCRGRDVPLPRHKEKQAAPKSISRETTFHKPLADVREIRAMIFYLLERAMRAARSGGLMPRTLELKIRYDDWKQHEARRTLAEPTDCDDRMCGLAWEMLERLHTRRVALRHVGVALSQFVPRGTQGELFTPPQQQRRRELYGTMDAIRDRFGQGAVVAGNSIELLGKLKQNDYWFVLRTPSLTK